MKLGFVSDSLSGQSLTDMLDNAQRMGVDGIEVNTGGWSTAPHCDLNAMLGDASARRAFAREFETRGLEIASLNANGNPLHPTDRAQSECLKDTIRLAGEMGIKTVCTMSGLPSA
jgi:sugar phosphate isomerase/epimerase